MESSFLYTLLTSPKDVIHNSTIINGSHLSGIQVLLRGTIILSHGYNEFKINGRNYCGLWCNLCRTELNYSSYDEFITMAM